MEPVKLDIVLSILCALIGDKVYDPLDPNAPAKYVALAEKYYEALNDAIEE